MTRRILKKDFDSTAEFRFPEASDSPSLLRVKKNSAELSLRTAEKTTSL